MCIRDRFIELVNSLIIRQQSVDDVIFLNLLEELRHRIDQIDEDILNMIAERMRIAREIGQYKSCLLYTSPSPRDRTRSRMPSSA